MKLTLQLQLLPSPGQEADLLATMGRFNEAANFAAKVGFEAKVFGQVTLHKLAYYEIRERFGLSSQMAVRAISKAVECFQRDKTKCPVFKPRSAICYDQRVLSFKGLTTVSLWALAGRLLIPFVCGAYQKERQGRIKGQADLVHRQGKFYLLCTIEMPEEAPITPKDIIGVDMGIVELATDSTGESFSGEHIESKRRHYAKRRAGLNRVGTKSARRRLSKMARRETNFRRDTNHCIAKKIVAKAKASESAIAIEDLEGIRGRLTVKKSQRNRLGGWGFAQLGAFLLYKATLAGVPVFKIDPRDTSRTCAECGYCSKANRKTQADFVCLQCGHASNADFNAARRIRAKASVRKPMVGLVDDGTRKPSEGAYKLRGFSPSST
jgi:putative transposase